jgi:hypothetical protein
LPNNVTNTDGFPLRALRSHTNSVCPHCFCLFHCQPHILTFRSLPPGTARCS